jgi:predicted ArsR family transcriptional regulator
VAKTYAQRLRETTRGRVLELLRREGRTVADLASVLGLTDNAVRSHLSALERDGLVSMVGIRREGVGKPAHVYALTEEAEERFPKAYATVLAATIAELVSRLGVGGAMAALDGVGRRLAQGGEAGAPDRLAAAIRVLEEMGAVVAVEETERGVRLQGYACPLAAVVRERPETCTVVQALVAEIVGVEVEQVCEHGPRPRCAFRVPVSPGAAVQSRRRA